MCIMKKLLTITLSILLLLLITLGAAGGASDPLVTRRWLEGEYRATLVRDLNAAIDKIYDNQYRVLTSRIDRGTPLTAPAGYTAAPSGGVSLASGQSLNVAQGTSFTVKSGDVSVRLVNGTVLDLTDGTVKSSLFTATVNHRYFTAEDTMVVITSQGRATLAVDGYIKLDGEALTHHPVFKDVSVDAWYYSAVDYAYSNALFSGTTATTFSPDVAMTRGMFVTVLGRLAGVNAASWASNTSQFKDVATNAYYAPYVRWASANNIVLGYSDNTFKPDESVTREQMAALMYRYELWQRGGSVTYDASKATAYPDYNKVSDWAREPIQWAIANGIINGSNGNILPQNTATRAQVAQIAMNYKKR